MLHLARESEEKLLEYDGPLSWNDINIPTIYNYHMVFKKWQDLVPLAIGHSSIAKYASDDFIKKILADKHINNCFLIEQFVFYNRPTAFRIAINSGLIIYEEDVLDIFSSCIRFNKYEILQILFESGYEFSKLDSYNMFYCLAYTENEEMLKILINNGADINCRRRSGSNLLHHFIMLKDFESAEMFLKYGVRPYVHNSNYEYPHDFINPGEDGELARNLYHQMHDACLEKGMKRIKIYS